MKFVHILTGLSAAVILAFGTSSLVATGIQVCDRCAGQREVTRLGPLQTWPAPRASSERAWMESRIGACSEHSWHNTGCWRSGGAVACTKQPVEHGLAQALAALDDEPAAEFARRFAALPAAERERLWKRAPNRYDPDTSPREIARTSAASAGWDDLAAAWP